MAFPAVEMELPPFVLVEDDGDISKDPINRIGTKARDKGIIATATVRGKINCGAKLSGVYTITYDRFITAPVFVVNDILSFSNGGSGLCVTVEDDGSPMPSVHTLTFNTINGTLPLVTNSFSGNISTSGGLVLTIGLTP